MKNVFVTGATGWVGSRVVKELLAAGHRVTGLVRNPDKAAGLEAAGATALLGTLDDLDVLRSAAQGADAVLHLAFNHDFSKWAENAEQDRRAIEVLGSVGRPLLVTSGTALVAPDQVSTESMGPTAGGNPRRSEQAATAVGASVVRLSPTVHGVGDYGFTRLLLDLAREKGVSAYLGDGSNRWPAVHVSDAARLYVLALDSGLRQPVYHAVAEEGVPFRGIAEALGRRLGVPVERRDPDHFGWFAHFAGADIPSSSAQTRAWLDWHPTGPGLLEDLGRPDYFG